MKDERTETQIQTEICLWLITEGFFFWRCNAMPTYGRSKFMPKGLPDIAVLHSGIFYGIEIKRATKPSPLSDEQKAIGDRILKSGGSYFVVHSLEEIRHIFGK